MRTASQRPRLVRSLVAGVSALALGFSLTACGSDDDDTAMPEKQIEGAADVGGAGDAAESAENTSEGAAETDAAGDSDEGVEGISSGGSASPEGTSTDVSAGEASIAAEELGGLEVREKGSMDDYEREEYGPVWSDGAEGVEFAGNGCKTRDDILERDLTDIEKVDDCQVESGTLYDPYGTEENPYDHYIEFERGQSTSGAVQIDHIVPLGNVHVSGGSDLDEAQKLQIANDPVNLLAVDGPENNQKQDSDASEWLPKNDRIHCRYAASQIQVKAKYGLSVTQEEHDTLSELISTCNV